jgi:ABC-2 type transport system ATP-binding protein
VIVIDGLTKRFGATLAVDDVSFEVEPGTIVGFLGHNGAGKTTTLRMLLGHVRPDTGSATIFGKRYAQLDKPLERVGVQFESGYHPGRTARNHLRASAAVGGLGTGRIDTVLGLVGLEDAADRKVGGYSQGMRQRLGLATALLAEPEILVLDEPGNGLDPEGVRWLRGLLRQLADAGTSVLLSSHQLAEVAQTVDHVVVIDRGAVVAESSLDELVRRAGTEVLVRSPGAEVLAEEMRRAGIATRGVSAEEMRARDVPPGVVSELAAGVGVPVWEVRALEPSLEEVFFDLTRGGNGDRAARPPGPLGEDPEEQERLDEAAQALADVEERLDRDLGRQPRMRRGTVVAVVAPKEGLGRTTLSFLLGEVLATGLGVRSLAVALSSDRERMCMPVPADERSPLNLTDLLADLPGFDEAARMTPYVSVAHSGLHTLCGPRAASELTDMTAQQIDDLLDFAGRFYEFVVLDVGDVARPALEAVLRRANEVVLLGSPDVDVSDSEVLEAVAAQRSERATIVFNRVEERRAMEFEAVSRQGTHALVPRDRELIRALDAGDFRLEQLQPTTRIALKRMGLIVAEGIT